MKKEHAKLIDALIKARKAAIEAGLTIFYHYN